MSQRHRYIPKSGLVLLALDLASLIGIETAALGAVQDRLQIAAGWQIPALVLVYALIEAAFLYSLGSYRRDTLANPLTTISRLPFVVMFSGAVYLPILHYGMPGLFQQNSVYRSISGTAVIVLVITGLAILAGIFSRLVFQVLVRRHVFRRRILVIGTGKRAEHLQHLLGGAAEKSLTHLIFLPQSVLGLDPAYENDLEGAFAAMELVPPSIPYQVIRGRDLETLVADMDIDEIVVAADERRGLPIERLLAFKSEGIPVTDFSGFIEKEAQKVDLGWVDVGRLVYSDGFEMRQLDLVAKRVFDIVVSLILLFLTLPLMMMTCLAVYLESGGPVFYRQERMTRGSRGFKLNKIRTMYVDAEKEGPRWAAAQDRRVTRIGALLRRTRIDEIPQLWNVIAGDMSLVGPRPERPVFVKQLAEVIPLYDLRHSVRAGLTGWAQINYPYGASEEDAKRKLEYDLYYIKNYTILRDALILLQTLHVVFWPQAQAGSDAEPAKRRVTLLPILRRIFLSQRIGARKGEPV